MNPAAILSLPVGVVVERRGAESPWLDYTWSVTDVLPGPVDVALWTPVGLREATDKFYAGTANVDLYRTETSNYRDNLASGLPKLWVVLRATEGSWPYVLHSVTADPAEGEAATEAGDDLVEAVPMPQNIRLVLEAFVAEHMVERPFVKRQRERPDLDARSRRAPLGEE